MAAGEPKAMHEYDKSSKWLIQHHGDSLLRLAGVHDFISWQPLQAELVQPRQLPDGMLEVQLAREKTKDLFILEIATYPEERVHGQILRDLIMVFLARGVLPETIILVLRPRGKVRVKSKQSLRSRLGMTWLQAGWRVVELWRIPAEQLFGANDVGLIPLVPLTDFPDPPEPVLRRCRQRIDEKASPEERANLLAVTQVMTRLRFKDKSFAEILGGSQAMIESPLIQEIEAKRSHKLLLSVLEGRFETIPEEIVEDLSKILDEKKLLELAKLAGTCKDLKSFRKRLKS
jgi:hypothetical protein